MKSMNAWYDHWQHLWPRSRVVLIRDWQRQIHDCGRTTRYSERMALSSRASAGGVRDKSGFWLWGLDFGRLIVVYILQYKKSLRWLPHSPAASSAASPTTV